MNEPAGLYFISIGSNIAPEIHIPKSLKRLREEFPSIVFSSIYETAPVGTRHQEKFWNLAAKITALLPGPALQAKLREIESELGRIRKPDDKFAPRTIDLDLLPQANYQRFAFIMTPLSEIAPRESDIETGKRFEELANLIDHAKQPCRKLFSAEELLNQDTPS